MTSRPITGHDLRALRERLGMSVDHMAELLHATAEEIEEWERTGAEISADEGWEVVPAPADASVEDLLLR